MKNTREKIVHKSYSKKGISLIALLITIIVALILIATVTISTKKAIDNANLTTFAKDLTEIQDAVESYYITNNMMPARNDYSIMSSNDLIDLSSDAGLISDELNQNNDMSSDFYAIDLSKINITKTPYGNKEGGDNSDVFIVALPSMNAYYPYGVEANNTTYYSLTEQISSLTKITGNPLDTSLTTVISSSGIKVTKNNGWANKMGINVDVNMNSGETLFMAVSGGSNRLITTTTGRNTFSFDTLSELRTTKVPTLTQAEADYIEAGTKPIELRYIEILKYKGSDLVGKVKVDLSNFSKNSPTIGSITLASYSTINTAKLVLSNSESGIRDVRYEYLTKYTDNGTIESYYTGITDFDSAYMMAQARKAKISNDYITTISVPKNVESIKIAIIDKAGNVSLYTQKVAPSVYIGYSIDSRTSTSLQLTAKMYSLNGIKSVTFAKSVDGINFTNEQSYALNTTVTGVTTKQCQPFTNIVSNAIYIKMVAINYDNSVVETRIIRIDMKTVGSALGLNTIAVQNSTINGETAAYNNPIVPKGFKAINDGTVWPTDWNKGLVIEDTSGNQFVWVPVDGGSVPYDKWCTSGISYNDAAIAEDSLPTGVTNEIDQISNYGGFYVARYEAGNSSSTLVSKKGIAVWNNINYTDAKTKAMAMYNTGSIRSGLLTGTQWDTTLEWIKDSSLSVTDSRTWGNHSDSLSPANVTGYGSLQTTGYSEKWKANNIYDLAGNAWEWSNEVYSTDRLSRGPGYNVSGTTYPVATRYRPGAITYTNANLSFRVVLYILPQDTQGLSINTIATENSTFDGKTAAYNNPIIPKGFKAINDGTTWPSDWNKGLVIEDTVGNQFVWVPVDGTNVKYEKWNGVATSYVMIDRTSNDTLPSGISSEMSQITKYGGFYIARYESGKESTSTLVSKKQTTVWASIIYADAKTKSESMYNTAVVKSGLVTGTQWDAVMKWLQNSGKNISTDSTTWGNVTNATAPANVTGFGVLQLTGFSEAWKANNIYDLEGNAWEWTSEIYTSSSTGTQYNVARGSSYYYSGTTYPAAFRCDYAPTDSSNGRTFRVVLYVL